MWYYVYYIYIEMLSKFLIQQENKYYFRVLRDKPNVPNVNQSWTLDMFDDIENVLELYHCCEKHSALVQIEMK